ncbi:MAG: Gfo/Idh/MocA family oxidoreductase [Candidatus Latescibacterota bacterium]
MEVRTIRCGVVGYGGAFNMGHRHLSSMIMNPGMEAVAVCDPDEARRQVAQKDWPQARTYARLGDMLKAARLDLVAIITPHDSHGKLAVQCLEAGVGVVCEKPMAITTREVKAMMAAARKSKVVLSTFHNRRWDGDFMTLRELVCQEQIIGRPFRIHAGFAGYGAQRDWWRADRRISGGSIYDWGAHFTDWILNLVPEPVDWVAGYQCKHPEWSRYTNEDHSEYTLCFRGGCHATLTMSNMAMSPQPRWRILGERGAVEDVGGKYLVKTWYCGRQMSTEVAFQQSNWDAYYRNVYEHLLGQAELVITPESAARVISVLEAANLSAEKGSQPVRPAFI